MISFARCWTGRRWVNIGKGFFAIGFGPHKFGSGPRRFVERVYWRGKLVWFAK